MLKKTKTRELVQKLLTNNTSPLSANEIYEQLKDEKITLSSIYRTLETFTNKNIIIKDINNQGIATYSIKKEEHCHFLECKNCHNKIKLDYCPYHKVNKQIKDKTSFVVDEHNVVIYGTCNKCINTKE